MSHHLALVAAAVLERLAELERAPMSRRHVSILETERLALPALARAELELCAHGYTAPDCPDCDVPSYWPAVLDVDGSAETEGI